MEKNGDVKERLKECGLKSTKHRKAILDFMFCSSVPISAEQVYIQMIEQGISIDLSTVYRTLETLREKGLLIKHDRLNDTRALYEYDRREHKHYLVCLGCNKMLPIRHCPLEEYEKDLEKATDFVIAGHKLDIFGYCAECQKKGLQE